jgi:hypothetical protein
MKINLAFSRKLELLEVAYVSFEAALSLFSKNAGEHLKNRDASIMVSYNKGKRILKKLELDIIEIRELMAKRVEEDIIAQRFEIADGHIFEAENLKKIIA